MNYIDSTYLNIIDFKKITTSIPRGKRYDMWRLKCLDINEFNNLTNKLLYICCFGVLAPTTHNTIPQRFHINEKNNTIDVWIDRKFILPASGKMGRQASISIGCSIGYIEHAARTYELNTRIQVLSDSKNNIRPINKTAQRLVQIASLPLHPEASEIYKLRSLDSITERQSLRAEYDNSKKINSSIISTINALINKKFTTIKINIFQMHEDLHKIGKLQEDADRSVFENSNFVNELGHWMLPNENHTSTYGMRGAEFGLEDDFSMHIHKGLLGEKKLLPDQIAGFARAGKIYMENSSAVFVISIDNNTIENWIDAGRVLSFILLLLQENSFFTSIHAGIAEVDWVNEVFNSSILQNNNKAVILVRAGKLKSSYDKNRPHSSRSFITDLLI